MYPRYRNPRRRPGSRISTRSTRGLQRHAAATATPGTGIPACLREWFSAHGFDVDVHRPYTGPLSAWAEQPGIVLAVIDDAAGSDFDAGGDFHDKVQMLAASLDMYAEQGRVGQIEFYRRSALVEPHPHW